MLGTVEQFKVYNIYNLDNFLCFYDYQGLSSIRSVRKYVFTVRYFILRPRIKCLMYISVLLDNKWNLPTRKNLILLLLCDDTHIPAYHTAYVHNPYPLQWPNRHKPQGVSIVYVHTSPTY